MTLAQRKSQQEVQREWQAHLRANASLFQSNDAPPRQLHFLASLYFGRSTWAVGKSARTRLRWFLDDEGLVALALDALAHVPARRDLPKVEDVLASAARNRMSHLGWPLLAGLEERSAGGVGTAPPLSDDGLRGALAIYAFYDPTPHLDEPKWHRWVVVNRPQLVAETIVAVYKVVLQTNRSGFYGLYGLCHDSRYAEIARQTIPSLLRAFPTRARADQLAMLTSVLAAALAHCDEDEFRAIVDRKLAAKTMGAKQRVSWMCAGLLRRPAAYLSRFERELEAGASQRRARYAAEFLGSDDIRARLARLEHLGAVALLIRRIGSVWPPFPIRYPAYGTTPGETVVPRLVDVAARCPEASATALLSSLTQDPALVNWHERLRRAARGQREVRRNAEFRFPPLQNVTRALTGGTPANAADLAALAYEELATLGRAIRDGQTSDWRQYWRTERDLWQPQAENDCRDRLLSDLHPRLARFNVAADKEPTYADDKRADIRVAASGFNVPVEIKKSNSPDLWDAASAQLVPNYTRDPGTAGHGILLAFWFGAQFCQRSKAGRRPASAAALQALLVESLPPALSGQIKVLVIDVARPEASGGSASARGLEAA